MFQARLHLKITSKKTFKKNNPYPYKRKSSNNINNNNKISMFRVLTQKQ